MQVNELCYILKWPGVKKKKITFSNDMVLNLVKKYKYIVKGSMIFF